MFRFGGASVAVVLGCGLVCVAAHGFPQRFAFQTQNFANARFDTGGFLKELTSRDIRADKLIQIGATDQEQSPTVFVWGDSHAMSALPAFDDWLKEQGLSGRAATHSSTPPILDWCSTAKFGLGPASKQYNDLIFEYLHEHRVTGVFLIAYWSAYQNDTGSYSAEFQQALVTTVERLVAIGCRPTLMLDVPVHSFDVPKSLSRFTVTYGDIQSLAARPDPATEFDGLPLETIARIKDAGGRIVDPKPRFLDPTGTFYLTHSRNFAYYRDQGHLTSQGARRVLFPFLRNIAQQPSSSGTIQQVGHAEDSDEFIRR